MLHTLRVKVERRDALKKYLAILQEIILNLCFEYLTTNNIAVLLNVLNISTLNLYPHIRFNSWFIKKDGLVKETFETRFCCLQFRFH